MRHELKTDPAKFDAVIDGKMRFDIRKNDRNFQVGDELMLRKTRYTGEEMANGKPLEYTGDFWTFRITYILFGPFYGLKEGWCIMGIAPLGEKNIKSGIELIAEERLRQIEKEGWTAEHDEQHECGELAIAAACYAISGLKNDIGYFELHRVTSGSDFCEGLDAWPWEPEYDKRRKHYILKRLSIAGALIAAEIDCLVRMGLAASARE